MMKNDKFVNCFNLDNDTDGRSLDRTLFNSLISSPIIDRIGQFVIAFKSFDVDIFKEMILAEDATKLRSSDYAGGFCCFFCLNIHLHV